MGVLEGTFHLHLQMRHKPVLLRGVLEVLDIKPDGIYVDATVGCGGHAKEIAKKLDKGLLICIDCDAEALRCAEETLSDFAAKIKLMHANFRDLAKLLDDLDIEAVEGILFDLGISSLQLDSAHRGFSFQKDGPLDMRMDQHLEITAKDIVNSYSAEELARLFKEFGEERWAQKIAREIIKYRARAEIQTTLQLAQIVESAIPMAAQRKLAIHPATKTFQALRMAVNDELENLKAGLQAGFSKLRQGGVMVVISFHSLEDRIVKNFFKEKAKGCICPPQLPACCCNKKIEAELFKLIRPSEQEIKENPRSRSAKLRAARKII